MKPDSLEVGWRGPFGPRLSWQSGMLALLQGAVKRTNARADGRLVG